MKQHLAYGISPVLIAFLLSACAGARVISGFGDSYDGEGKYRTEGAHVGVDVWGNPGDSVLAAADGRVEVVTEAEK